MEASYDSDDFRDIGSRDKALFREPVGGDFRPPVRGIPNDRRKRRNGSARGRIAKLIAAIPFLAGCEDAERTAVAHPAPTCLSTREDEALFQCQPEDRISVLERLRLGSNFKGGDRRIIDRGLCLLALNMVSDYHRDIEEDAALGKYNPIAAGAWDFESTSRAWE